MKVPLASASSPSVSVPSTVYTKDPVRRILSGLVNGNRTSMPNTASFATQKANGRSINGIEWLLSTFGDPASSVVRLNPGAGVNVVTNAVIRNIGPGGSLSERERDKATLTRQVTLTDFCRPEAERPGAIILTLRHPLDITNIAISSTPPGRNPRDLEEAWIRLSDVASVAVNRAECGGVRASLITLSFLAAALHEDYPNRDAAEALRAHVIANYGDRRAGARLDGLGECLRIMVRSHMFPHRVFNIYGGLLSWISQDELSSVTAVVRGVQEAARTDQTNAPRSSVSVPACVFLDVDNELGIKNDGGVCYLYLFFLYTQRLNREGVRVCVGKSRLNDTVFRDGLSHLFARLRAENAIRGVEGSNAPRPDANAEFPLLRLFGDRTAPRCSPARLGDRTAVDALYRWTPDLRGRPTQRSCMYAAYMRLGMILTDRPKTTRIHERYGSVELPVVRIEGLTWAPGEWVECF
ncbi:capsid triplex subunit 1 [Spheniscid alphaherpesvirus 1]|uniref:Capsid triplex subunit 1 n=1 Tax=Spheniscid alphaherpesvirus 1 TaxID=2560777 RepID=A0A1R3T3J8_9ALPH|nr:capsid triplex subunit 1 [Spheniscid alphaherpesvirus 1]